MPYFLRLMIAAFVTSGCIVASGQSSSAQPKRVSSLAMHRLALYHPTPELTKEMKKAKIHGIVNVMAVVGTDGKVSYVHGEHGPADLRELAEKALSKWVFRPYLVDGKPITVSSIFTFVLGRPEAIPGVAGNPLLNDPHP